MRSKVLDFMHKQGLNPYKYRYLRKDAESYVFLHKPSGKTVAIRR